MNILYLGNNYILIIKLMYFLILFEYHLILDVDDRVYQFYSDIKANRDIWFEVLKNSRKTAKEVELSIGGKNYKEKIGQSYMITAKGIQALNKANGKSRHKRISKNISWEMLATKGIDRNYIRTRRALIIKSLIECKSGLTLEEIRDRLEIQAISELFTVVKDDLDGLINIGLNIEKIGEKYYFNDEINDFIIPIIENSEKSEFTQEQLVEKIDLVDQSFLENYLNNQTIIEAITKELVKIQKEDEGKETPQAYL